MLTVRNVELDSFGIEASETGGCLLVKLTGTAEMMAYEPLRSAIAQIRDDAARLGLGQICIDIRALYLLNSSCIKLLVRLVYLAQTEKPTFTLEFKVDPHLSWQTRALLPLARMAFQC